MKLLSIHCERSLRLIFALTVAACTMIPEWPGSVLAETEIIMGPNAQIWIDCGQQTKGPYATFQCTVYDAHGEVPSDDSYVVVQRQDAPLVLDLHIVPKDSPSAFDGHAILLVNKRMLIPERRVHRHGAEPAAWNAAEHQVALDAHKDVRH
jgi:hypothetical protein